MLLEGGFVITFPDWDWGVTQGEDEADAIDMAQDALITMIAHSIRHGKPVPPPSSQTKGKKYRMIELPAKAALKTELYIAFKASGITKDRPGAEAGYSDHQRGPAVRLQEPHPSGAN